MSRYNLGCLGQCIGKYYRKGHQRITGFDYSEAADVKLWLGTEGYDLKSTNQKMLHRDPGVQGDEAERKELSTHLKELHKDETSASIVEKGYYYSVDKSRTADIFEFDLKAITGDTQNSKMVFDVVVEDEVLTGMYDTVHLCIACVAEDLYNPDIQYNWNCIGYGIQDEKDKRVYHVTMDGAMFGFGPTVIDICRLGFDVDRDCNSGVLWYEVEPEVYLVDVPRREFYPVHEGYYGDMVFLHNGRGYEIRIAYFGMYQTKIGFYTDIDAKEVPANEYELREYEEELQKEWLDFARTLRLVADGKEYKVIDEDGKRGYLWLETEEREASYKANAYPYFPPIDFLGADVIELKSGDTVYRLK